jgi:hypothetical protein
MSCISNLIISLVKEFVVTSLHGLMLNYETVPHIQRFLQCDFRQHTSSIDFAKGAVKADRYSRTVKQQNTYPFGAVTGILHSRLVSSMFIA